MVINSPCLTDKKELAILGQTTTGKELSNPLIAEPFSSLNNSMASLKFVNQHNMVAYLEKSDDNTEFHQIVNFLSSCSITYALTQIHVVVDGKAVVISESLVRSDLLFDDEDGITCLTNDEIFKNLALMGYEPLSTKLTFQKDEAVNQEEGDRVKRAITTDASLAAAPGQRGVRRSFIPRMKKDQETAEHSSGDHDETLAETLLNIKRSLAKDKGKGIMQVTELLKKLKKKEMIHSKKQRLDQQSEEEAKAQGDSDQEVEELKNYMRIIHEEDIEIEAMPLAIKPLVIIEYKIVKEVQISTYHIKRADGSTKRYTSMINLLKNIDREDLETLWKLVKDKYSNTRLEEGFKNLHIFLLVDKVYPLTPATIKMMLERKLQTDQWNKMCYQLFKLMMKQLRKQSSVWKNPLRV
nr:hypothetical protein [Tanacetum cinerariifolium]